MTGAEIGRIQRSLGTIEGRLPGIDSKLDMILARQDDQDAAIAAQGVRVTRVENRLQRWGGGIAVLLGMLVFFKSRIVDSVSAWFGGS